MAFALIAIHIAMILIARQVWRRRGLVWSAVETATCVVMPVVVLFVFGFAASLIPRSWFPQSWFEEHNTVFAFIVFTIPLAGFWTWFFLFEGKRRKETPEVDDPTSSAMFSPERNDQGDAHS